MARELNKVRSGDKLRIPAAAYNAFVDVARDLHQRQQRQDQEPQAHLRDSGIVLVKNGRGTDRQPIHVRGISDAAIERGRQSRSVQEQGRRGRDAGGANYRRALSYCWRHWR